MSKVFVVVPNWNGKAYLKSCLESLQAQSASARIVVVDNGSADGSVGYLEKVFPTVKVIALSKNFGFAGGVNRGIEYALSQQADYVALLNNDASADKDWLKQLLSRMHRSSKIAVVTGKLLRTSGKIDSAGEAYSIWGLPFPIGRDEPDRGQFTQARQITAATGGASLFRGAVFKQIGMFDEAFFAYYEDVDVCLRARSRGWQIWYEPGAVAHHQVGATSSKLGGFTSYHSLKNLLYLYDKNLPARLFWRYLPRKLVAFGLSWLVAIRRGHGWSALKAVAVAALRLPIMLAKRWQIQAQRQVDWPEFDSWLYHSAPPTSKTLKRLSVIFDRKQQ